MVLKPPARARTRTCVHDYAHHQIYHTSPRACTWLKGYIHRYEDDNVAVWFWSTRVKSSWCTRILHLFEDADAADAADAAVWMWSALVMLISGSDPESQWVAVEAGLPPSSPGITRAETPSRRGSRTRRSRSWPVPVPLALTNRPVEPTAREQQPPQVRITRHERDMSII